MIKEQLPRLWIGLSIFGFIAGALVLASRPIHFLGRPSELAASKIAPLSFCHPNGSGDCWSEAITASVNRHGPDVTLALLGDQAEKNATLSSWCHAMAHEVGHQTWSRTHDVARAFNQSRQHGAVCASGFYHGVLEGAVAELGRQKLGAEVADLCQFFARTRRGSLDHYNCVHGLGHGFFAIADDQWPAALKLCDRLRTDWEKSSCASGVFMQNLISRGSSIGHHADFRADDPLYPCDQVDGGWAAGCYINQGGYLYDYYHGDVQKIALACSSIPDRDSKTACWRGLGLILSSRHQTDSRLLVADCRLAGDGTDDCLLGVARDRQYFHFPISQTLFFCQQSSPAQRSHCSSVLAADRRSEALIASPITLRSR